MIIDKSDKTIVSTGIQSEAFFSVKQENLSHLLGILRNQLYSDKIQAVIREYCTNAMDANIDAGVPDCPIQVSLPNSFSPIFKVRDFGKGLSEEQIYNIYISFGDSSKRNTNTQTGCLGLGSKSAFAYVDNFTLTSYHGGLKSVYSAYIDESEIGKITRLTCEPSDEATGIEVSLAVKSGDYRQFSEKCFDVLKYFIPKPIVHNDSQLQDKIDTWDAKPIMSTDNWTLIHTGQSYYRTSPLKVVMGNVAYTVNPDSLPVGAGFRDYIYSFHGMEILIKAPIGAVKNSASREALDYNPKTQSWLFKALADFKEQVGDELSKSMESAKTMWEAKMLYNELSNKIGSRNVLKYRGKPMTSFISFPECAKARKVVKTRNDNLVWDKQSVHCKPTPNTRIFVDRGDIKRNELFSRIASFGDLRLDTYLVQFDSPEQADAFLTSEEFEGSPWIDLKDANYVKRPRQASGVKSVYSEGYTFQRPNGCRNADHWKPCQIDMSNGEGVYIEISHFIPVNKNTSVFDVEQFVKMLRRAGIDTEIHGVRGKTAKALGAGWKSYQTYQKELFDSITEKHCLEPLWDVTTVAVPNIVKDMVSKSDDYNFPPVIQDVVDTVKYTNRLEMNEECQLARHLFENYREDHVSKLKPMIQEVYAKYPMLHFAHHMWDDDEAQRVMDYINLVG